MKMTYLYLKVKIVPIPRCIPTRVNCFNSKVPFPKCPAFSHFFRVIVKGLAFPFAPFVDNWNLIFTKFPLFAGVYHSFTGGKQKTTHEYLRGGDRISVWSAALSLTVSFMSAASMLGYPAEIYTFGGQFWLGTLGWALGAFLSAVIYVPVLYPLQTTTSNEVNYFGSN